MKRLTAFLELCCESILVESSYLDLGFLGLIIFVQGLFNWRCFCLTKHLDVVLSFRWNPPWFSIFCATIFGKSRPFRLDELHPRNTVLSSNDLPIADLLLKISVGWREKRTKVLGVPWTEQWCFDFGFPHRLLVPETIPSALFEIICSCRCCLLRNIEEVSMIVMSGSFWPKISFSKKFTSIKVSISGIKYQMLTVSSLQYLYVVNLWLQWFDGRYEVLNGMSMIGRTKTNSIKEGRNFAHIPVSSKRHPVKLLQEQKHSRFPRSSLSKWNT